MNQLELHLAFNSIIDAQTPYGIRSLTIDVDGSSPFIGPDVTASGATIRKAELYGIPTDAVTVQFDPAIATSPAGLTLTFSDFDIVQFLAGTGSYPQVLDLLFNLSDPGVQVLDNFVQAVDANRPPPDIRAWEFEATILRIDDPASRFHAADVRIGDTISGTFSYDLSTPPSLHESGNSAEFAHAPNSQGAQWSIENPRSETRLDYFPLRSNKTEYWVYLSEFNGEEEGFAFYQEPATTVSELVGGINLEFIRPDTRANGLSLPRELNLDDWDVNYISISSGFSADGLEARIHSLSSVTPGDFDLNGSVEAQDYTVWRNAYGFLGFSHADSNRDGRVDAADYTMWRDNLSGGHSAINTPEPTSLGLAISMSCAVALLRACFGTYRGWNY